MWKNKKIIIIVCLTIIVIVAIILVSRNKNVEEQQFQNIDNSKLIKYNKECYEVIPSDMIKKGSSYAKILDSLNIDYNVKKEYIKEKVGELEDGGCIYRLESGKDKVLIIKDYNGELVYAFKV